MTASDRESAPAAEDLGRKRCQGREAAYLMPHACLFLRFLLLLDSRHFLNPVSLHAQLQLPRPTKKMRGWVGALYLKLLINLPLSHASHSPPSSTIRVWGNLGLLFPLFSRMGKNMAVLTPLPVARRAPWGTMGHCISSGLTTSFKWSVVSPFA